MYTDVYVDVLFLINFSMDAIALYLTSRLCSLGFKRIRIFVAGSIGALYSVVSVFLSFPPLVSILLAILVSLFMIYVSFEFRRFLEGLKYTVVLFICSSLLGGLISALYSLLSEAFSSVSVGNGVDFTPYTFVILAVVSLFLALILTRLHGTGNLPQSVGVSIVLFGKKVECQAIIDSGNMLIDPLSHKYVAIVRSELFSGLLSREFLRAAMENSVEFSYKISDKEKTVFRIVPSSGVCGRAFLYGVCVDEIRIYIKQKNKTRVPLDL